MNLSELLGDTIGSGEADPIISRPDADLDSESADDAWSNCTPYPLKTQYGHVSRRYMRSRSSPVRAVEDKKGRKVRTRSPSLWSPRRRQARHRSREHIPRRRPESFIPPEYAVDSRTTSEDYLQTANSYWCGLASNCGSAYFSLRPPAAPLRLVPIVTPAEPPLPPPLCSGVKRVTRVSFAKMGAKDSDSTVRGLLRELVTCLPLESHRKASSCASHVCTLHEQDEQTPISQSCIKLRSTIMHSLPRGDSDRSLRSIAIQAKSTPDNDTKDNDQKKAEVVSAPAEEWMGGVRALRDSHVRLVLRQLRHIDRLNRALDRAGRAPTAPPPSPRVAHLHTPTTVAAHAQV